MAQLFYVRCNVRIYNSTRTAYDDYGTHNFFLPYADPNNAPATGAIVEYGLTLSLYDSYLAWMPDMSVLTNLYTVYPNSNPNEPGINWLNYFPKNIRTVNNYDSNAYCVLINTKNGHVNSHQVGASVSRFYPTIEDFEADTNIRASTDPLWGTGGLNSSSGGTRGDALPLYYGSLDINGRPSSIYRMQIRGVTSTTNRIQVSYIKQLTYPAGTVDHINWWAEFTELSLEDTDPYSDIDGQGEITGGGTGTVGVPGFPGLTATDTGIIGLFAPSAAQMQALANFMWTDFGGTGTTTEDILKEIVEALKRSISNPLDYVIGLNIIPSQGLSIGAAATIRFGFISSGVTMPRLSNQYFAVDCGSIDFDPICGDTFLDYAPYSKFSIYLPYIGFKDVDANDFVGHTIGVVYHGDTVTGGVTAYITKDGSVMYQYSGCCALNIPLSADNWGNTISGAVQIATALIGGAATGGAAGIAQAAAQGAASVAANPSLLSPQVMHSGAVSGGAGCMGVQFPFIIREAVRFHETDYFNTVSGYPAFYYKALSDVSGFTKALDVHLKGMTATQAEVDEIETLLKGGVFF